MRDVKAGRPTLVYGDGRVAFDSGKFGHLPRRVSGAALRVLGVRSRSGCPDTPPTCEGLGVGLRTRLQNGPHIRTEVIASFGVFWVLDVRSSYSGQRRAVGRRIWDRILEGLPRAGTTDGNAEGAGYLRADGNVLG